MAEQTLTPAPVRDGAWRVLFVLSGNMVLDAVEVSVVLVALPSIAADLRLSVWTVQWLMTGFALGFAAMLLLGPRLTARFGLRRCYLGALLVFAAASVVGGLSDTVWILVAARLVKGGCAALTAPAGLTLIAATFPDGPPLRRAVSVYSLFGAAGFTLGLLLSGLLTPVSWHWTFLFPAPVALILLGWGLRVLPNTERRRPPRLPAGLWRHGTLVRSTLGAALLNGTYAALLLVITFQAAVRFGWGPGHLALALLRPASRSRCPSRSPDGSPHASAPPHPSRRVRRPPWRDSCCWCCTRIPARTRRACCRRCCWSAPRTCSPSPP